MDLKFQWKLTIEEGNSIISKIDIIFDKNQPLPTPNQFISKSPAFYDDQYNSGTKWYLEITSGKGHYLQVKLCLADAEKFAPLCITYKLGMKAGQNNHASFEGKDIFDPKQICKTTHSEKFMNVHYYKNLSHYWGSNNMTFFCDMNIQLVQGASNILGCIQTDYEKLLIETKYSDFMLITSTKKFNVHKNILAVRSEVFAAMFEHDMKETKEGFAEIKEFDDEVVQEFLRYMYCGKVEHLDKLAKDLLVAAEKYLMVDLKVLCLEEICKNINIENAMELLVLVDNHHVEHLTSSVIDFIVQNIKDSTIKSNLSTIENGKLSNEILCRAVNKYL